MKHLLALILLVTLSLPTFAKEVGETIGTNGKLVFHDTPCKLVPLGNHFQSFDGDGKPGFTGCWLLDDGKLYLIDDAGRQATFDPSVVTWFLDKGKQV
jgi:hypothetical protein